MTNLFEEGLFTKRGNQFFSNNSVRYIIAERKKPNPKKSQHFIIAKTKDKEYYISSLFPTSAEDHYKAEYGGQYFNITISPNNVKVSAV